MSNAPKQATSGHKGELGEWRWFCGVEEDDDEMAECGTRADAIAFGLREHRSGESFWIVEARMLRADEQAMGAGEADSAPFADSRGGAWITVGDEGQPVEANDAPG